MKKLVSLVIIFSFIFSMTCFAERQRVAEIKPKDRDIAWGLLSLVNKAPNLPPTSLAEFVYNRVVGWTNSEVYYEDDFGRIVSVPYGAGE